MLMVAIAGMLGIGSTDTVLNAVVQPFYVSDYIQYKLPPLPLPPTPAPAVFLLIDHDSINNGTRPNSFSDLDVNAQIARPGLRLQLPYFASHVNETVALPTGEVGDEGWFALTNIPDKWVSTGPTDNGLRNFLGADNNTIVGLGLDNITNVMSIGNDQLVSMYGDSICAVVYAGEISVDSTNIANLAGSTLGIASFKIISIEAQNRSSTTLPIVTINILDANKVCGGPLILFNGTEPTANTGPEQPNTINEVPRNSSDFGNVPENTTQDIAPVVSNSSGTSSESADNSTSDINQKNANSSAGNSANDQEGSKSDQGASQNESGGEASSGSGGNGGSTPAENTQGG